MRTPARKGDATVDPRTADRELGRRARVAGPDAARTVPLAQPGSRAAFAHCLQQASGNHAASRLLQRAVGFEFETAWQVTKKGKPPPKYTKLKQGAGWHMETDEASATISDVEFVVYPPAQESGAGRLQLVAAMTSLENFVQALDNQKGQAKLSGAPALTPFVDQPKGVVIKPKGDIAGQPQATIGLRLDRVDHLISAFRQAGSDAEDELIGNERAWNSATLGRAQQWATNATDPNRPLYVPSGKMRGLLALIYQYLDRGRMPVAGATPYAKALKYTKAMTTVMARTNFAGLFRLVENTEKDYYNTHPAEWVNFVLSSMGGLAANVNVIERGMRAPKNQVVQIPITREQWLMGMLAGVDLLTAEAFKQWMPTQPKVESGEVISGAFGRLGHKTDDVGQLQAIRGAILELRDIKQGLAFEDWGVFATDVFDWIMALNAWDPTAGAGVPVYTKTAAPARGIRN